MRPYFFGVVLLSSWTVIAAGVVANLAGVRGVGNTPMILVAVEAASVDPLSGFDASVPLAGSPNTSSQRSAL